jgi:exonuclease III
MEEKMVKRKHIKLILAFLVLIVLKEQASLPSTMSIFKPSIGTLQETKVRKSGRLKLKGYQIFENVRKDGNGGGLLTAADENLMPVLISTGKEDDSEILTIQLKAGNHDIRIINAYCPQEDDSNKDVIYRFWQEIEEEITNAKDDNCMIVIQMDENAKIGKKHVKNDPNDDTHNGGILIDVVERQQLAIVNTMELCKGVITRERITAIQKDQL